MPSLAQKRSEAEKQLGKLFDDPSRVLIIHYACEDFANRPDGTSARITSIAVRHLNSAVTESFSVHLSAERLSIPYTEIKSRYDDLEKHMLQRFNDFVTKHLSFTWMHWNMRDSNYGFPAIYHRCRLYGIEPSEIPNTALFDLARTLVFIYGPSYIGHPRLQQLMEKNNISDLAFIPGADEPKAFEAGDYVSVHRSTLRKVDNFESIASRAHAGTLKTNYRWRDIYGRSPRDVVIYPFASV
jgi:hypothetical protein